MLRIGSRDNMRYPAPTNYRSDRVNLQLKEGRVDKALCG